MKSTRFKRTSYKLLKMADVFLARRLRGTVEMNTRIIDDIPFLEHFDNDLESTRETFRNVYSSSRNIRIHFKRSKNLIFIISIS